MESLLGPALTDAALVDLEALNAEENTVVPEEVDAAQATCVDDLYDEAEALRCKTPPTSPRKRARELLLGGLVDADRAAECAVRVQPIATESLLFPGLFVDKRQSRRSGRHHGLGGAAKDGKRGKAGCETPTTAPPSHVASTATGFDLPRALSGPAVAVHC